jgi:hypothetical protein
MIITFIPQDKIILKDKVPEYITDETFLSNYADIRCYQIDTNGNSWLETNNRVVQNITQEQIDIISNKFESEKQKRIQLEQEQFNAYQNSWERVRSQRDELLKETDVYLISDYPISNEKRIEVQNYRMSLRNIPETYLSNQPSQITFENGNVLINNNITISKPSL